MIIFGFWSPEIFIPARQPLHLELSMIETDLTESERLCHMPPVKAERGHLQEKQVEIRAIMVQQRQIYHGDNFIACNTVFSGGCTKPEPELCVFSTVFRGNIKRALGLITVQRLFCIRNDQMTGIRRITRRGDDRYLPNTFLLLLFFSQGDIPPVFSF